MPDDERSIPPRRPRVCVVDSQLSVPAYDRLDECHLDVMAVLPRISEVEIALLRGFDVVILGCTESMLLNRNFERRATRIAQLTRLVGVAPNPTPDALDELTDRVPVGLLVGGYDRERESVRIDRSSLAGTAPERDAEAR